MLIYDLSRSGVHHSMPKSVLDGLHLLFGNDISQSELDEFQKLFVGSHGDKPNHSTNSTNPNVQCSVKKAMMFSNSIVGNSTSVHINKQQWKSLWDYVSSLEKRTKLAEEEAALWRKIDSNI